MKFEKVSYEEFSKAVKNSTLFKDVSDIEIKTAYDNIKLPVRKTACSAGYDFSLPLSIDIKPMCADVIPTGIKVNLDSDKVLMLYVRSSWGFKYQTTLANTTGVIDADYYNNPENEGHIMVKLVNNRKTVRITADAGECFVQGVIMQFYKTEDDNSETERVGGIGSTSEGIVKLVNNVEQRLRHKLAV